MLVQRITIGVDADLIMLGQDLQIVLCDLGIDQDAVVLVANIIARDATAGGAGVYITCLLYTSPSPRDRTRSRMPSSA